MAAFNFDNLTANLPDAFYKGEDGVFYKLLQVDKHIYDGISRMLQSVYDILDIDNATGKTLDLYGTRIMLERGSSSDEQYRLRLKGKIGQTLCDGSHEGVVSSLAYVLQCDTSQIQIKTGANTGEVELLGIPLDILTNAGFSDDEITELINDLLPENVVLAGVNYTGTFEFAETDNEQSDTQGFADENGTIGGFFGLSSI